MTIFEFWIYLEWTVMQVLVHGIGMLRYICLYLFRLIFWHVKVSDFKRRTVVISGCDSGFGQLMALDFYQRGLTVIAGCLTEDGQYRLNSEVKKLGNKSKMLTLNLNITSDDSVHEFVEEVKKFAPDGVWTLVNNAGIGGTTCPSDWLTVDDFQRPMEVNFYGTLRLTQAFLPMIKNTRGRLVFVNSVLGQVGNQTAGPYTASKFALAGYTDTLRNELKDFDIKVISIVPGGHLTSIVQPSVLTESLSKRWAALTPQKKREYPLESFLEKKKSFIRDWILRSCAWNSCSNVVGAVRHATIARDPLSEYWIGFEVSTMYRITRLLTPDAQLLELFILRKCYGDGFAVSAAAGHDK